MRKPLLAGVAIFLLLSVPVWMAVVPLGPCPVTKEAWDRIRPGMSRAQVEAILGGPPGDYRDRPTHPKCLLILSSCSMLTRDTRRWHGNEGVVEVPFDNAGVVVEKEFTEETPAGWVETLRWRLNRRWDRLWGR